jgi:2'-5' RNA ligase
MQNEEHRLFVALPVPEPIKDAMERAQSELRRKIARAGVSWTRRAQFHLTLKFLGDVATSRFEALTRAVHAACEPFPALALEAKGIGCFPNTKFPRVLWIGVRDANGRLPDLQRAIDAAAREFTENKPEGSFAGHVTVGRVKQLGRSEADSLRTAVAESAATRFGEWTGNEVEIIRSELLAGGSRYTTVAKFSLVAVG